MQNSLSLKDAFYFTKLSRILEFFCKVKGSLEVPICLNCLLLEMIMKSDRL